MAEDHDHAQTDNLYRAEQRVWAELGAPARTLADLRNVAERLLWSPWWGKRFGDQDGLWFPPDITIVGHAEPWAQVLGHRIKLGPGWCSEFVLCHELAHVAVDDSESAHDPSFASAYVDIVGYAISAFAGRVLRRALKTAGIQLA